MPWLEVCRFFFISLDESPRLDYNLRHPAEGKDISMTAKRIVVIILGFAVGASLTLGIMFFFEYVVKMTGMLNFGLPNFLLTSFCFGCAAIIILDGLLHTNMLKR